MKSAGIFNFVLQWMIASFLISEVQTFITLGEIEKMLKQKSIEENKQCGERWKQEYTEFHKAQLQKPNPRKLVAIPNLSGKTFSGNKLLY